MIGSDPQTLVTLLFTLVSTEGGDRVRVFECSSMLCEDERQLAEMSYAYLPVFTTILGFFKVTLTSDEARNAYGFVASWASVSIDLFLCTMHHRTYDRSIHMVYHFDFYGP